MFDASLDLMPMFMNTQLLFCCKSALGLYLAKLAKNDKRLSHHQNIEDSVNNGVTSKTIKYGGDEEKTGQSL